MTRTGRSGRRSNVESYCSGDGSLQARLSKMGEIYLPRLFSDSTVCGNRRGCTFLPLVYHLYVGHICLSY